MNLSLIHEKILFNVINLYNKCDRPLRASEVAHITDHNVGTIRNHMQILKMLGMIKGITGPKGGYVPTSNAYKTLSINDANEIDIHLNNKKMKDVSISEIKLNPNSHSMYSGSIQIVGNVKNFSVGDTVIIRSPINTNAIIKGKITGMDFSNNTLYSSPIEILID
jgi:predicted transcriptional regulator